MDVQYIKQCCMESRLLRISVYVSRGICMHVYTHHFNNMLFIYLLVGTNAFLASGGVIVIVI